MCVLADEDFELVSIEETEPGWITYKMKGSNGNPITGGRAGTLEAVREEITQQVTKANNRRMVRQHWAYWNWNPRPAF